MNLRAGLDQAPGVFREDVAVLPERVLVEEEADRILFLILNHVRGGVMDHLETVRFGLGLDRDTRPEVAERDFAPCASGFDRDFDVAIHADDVARRTRKVEVAPTRANAETLLAPWKIRS